ncbi:MAG: NUDIX hydrolase, partial [Lactococcus lactis]|nr:NUDIX hydrolase [Lactococcus lactis]
MVEKFDLLKHFGVYGVAIDNDKLLVIEKNSGPYQNRYDLPGGSQEVGESMVDTLEREILEETGFTVLSSAKSRLYSAWIYENDRRVVSHHIFNLFDVKLNHVSKKLPQFVPDGKNDSDRAVWKLVTEL